tara:strand:- start:281 stop:805 length:525 start_codon:yes stop_codon:yes gene_type:complete
MRIGSNFYITSIPFTIDNIDKKEDAGVVNSSGYTVRKSQISWINDRKILDQFLEFTHDINATAGWNFEIDAIEPLQYTEYAEGGEYGWHVDQHSKPYDDGRIRKISFSLILNDDFEGGDFDLEYGHPNKNPRHETFCLGKNEAIFFKSDYWHRVNPVKSGIRRSLVGWILGKKY